ncbi:hypothetical protein ACOXXX_12255 [Thalassococcus sp. BH17M4-6]|uniref:hypothetical protein n=1 Tax=Thalassococcus sp. BH17M4-6 TaxID=3413148 RepID=UPI003BD453B2
MRLFLATLFLMIAAATSQAQTREVFPGELSLTVTVANADVVPYTQEMILITIHGQYRRHVTLESLEQPDLADFNWMQLGEDHWYDTQVNGLKVKNLKRRMALYPEKAGRLTIGPFVHHLTLTDEGDDWFEHDIRSDPITIEVAPAPATDDWWFPVRQLRVSDRWSNAPDQLRAGEGVLRIIRVEAVGVGPDMIPPMPELNSPSAMIFAHPEQRLVELSPEGPVSVAFWRWTIRPTNDTSAIIEPLAFNFFDTRNRVPRTVTISAQRVAMNEADLPAASRPPEPAQLHPWVIGLAFALALAGGLVAILLGRRFEGWQALQRLPPFDPLRRALWRAARRDDLTALRRAAQGLGRRDGMGAMRRGLLDRLDRAIFSPGRPKFDARDFAGRFAAAGRKGASNTDTIG